MKEFEIAEGGLKRVIAVRLHPGEDVLLRLEQLCREKNMINNSCCGMSVNENRLQMDNILQWKLVMSFMSPTILFMHLVQKCFSPNCKEKYGLI